MWYNRKTALIIIVALFAACQTMNVPEAYNYKVSEIQTNPYGFWISICRSAGVYSLVRDSISGELLCLDSDTLYILEADSLAATIFAGDVVKAEMYTHRNQAGLYAGLTGSLLFPNFIGALAYMEEFGIYFLELGIPVAVIGILQVLLESTSPERNILSYPSNPDILEFRPFARFPAGKPQGVDLNSLTLKKSK